MKNNFGYIIAAALVVGYLGACALSSNWERIDKDNNAFAKDCNDRGGVAFFETDARQCIGARPTRINYERT